MHENLIASAVLIEDLRARTKEEALSEILDAVLAAGKIAKKDVPAVLHRLREREELGTTGIGNGVAVPHVKGQEVKNMSLILARSAEGIEYRAIDGRPVHIVFLILAPADQPEAHLRTLRWISVLARNPDFRRFTMNASNAEEIRELLDEMSSAS